MESVLLMNHVTDFHNQSQSICLLISWCYLDDTYYKLFGSSLFIKFSGGYSLHGHTLNVHINQKFRTQTETPTYQLSCGTESVLLNRK